MEKVRVLQVIGAMNRAGAETVVMNLMRTFDRDRFQFDFLVHTTQQCDYDSEIESLGGTIYRVPHYNIANGFSYRLACRDFFAKHPEIQVVHGHIASCAAIYLDEAKKAGCATIAHSHRESPKGTLEAKVRTKLYRHLIKDLPRIADEFLGCAYQAGLDRFGPAVVGGAHFNVMPNGIRVSDYSCDEQGHLAAKRELGYEGAPLVGYAARFVSEKNQEFLIRVFAKYLPSNPQARLLLMGRGPLEDDMKELAARLGIAGNVDFLGVRDDLPEVLKALDAFVFPSKVEGLPLTAVEAQSAGLPCLFSEAIPMAAVVLPETQRISLDEGVDEWARRLKEMFDNPIQRKSREQEVAAHGYDIAAVARDMEDLYARLVAHCPRSKGSVQ